MRSNTEGWSNQQLNNRIETLENKIKAFKKYLYTIVIPSVSDITNLNDILEAEV